MGSFTTRLGRAASIALLGAAAACQSYSIAPVGQFSSSTTVAAIEVPKPPVNDVLFVVDDSGSMLDKQKALSLSAEGFIRSLVANSSQFRIGLITTDVRAEINRGRLREFSPGVRWLDAPDAKDPEAEAKRSQLVDTFVALVLSLSNKGGGDEAGLGNAVDALVGSAHVGETNAGFLRSQADLAVIILTDEDDCSRTAESRARSRLNWNTNAACYSKSHGAEMVDPRAIPAQLAALKGGDIRRIRAAVIGGGSRDLSGAFVVGGCMPSGTDSSPACRCWASTAGDPAEQRICEYQVSGFEQPDPPLPNCDSQGCSAENLSCHYPNETSCVPRCRATAARRYEVFLSALEDARKAAGSGGGTFADSICLADFGTSLSTIANDIVAPSCYPFAPAAKSADDVAVRLVHRRSDNGFDSPRLLPRFAPGESGACTNCTDCPSGAWRYEGPTSLCLTCGARLAGGDRLDVQVLSASGGQGAVSAPR